jgi:hypothetical protein
MKLMIAGFALLAIGFGAGDARAQATVTQGESCGIFIQPGPGGAVIGTAHDVQTPNGNENYHCKGSTTLPQQVFKDHPCDLTAGSTTEAQAVVSAGGNAHLSCHIQ